MFGFPADPRSPKNQQTAQRHFCVKICLRENSVPFPEPKNLWDRQLQNKHSTPGRKLCINPLMKMASTLW